LGMLVIVPQTQVDVGVTAVPQACIVGEIVAGSDGVIFEE